MTSVCHYLQKDPHLKFRRLLKSPSAKVVFQCLGCGFSDCVIISFHVPSAQTVPWRRKQLHSEFIEGEQERLLWNLKGDEKKQITKSKIKGEGFVKESLDGCKGTGLHLLEDNDGGCENYATIYNILIKEDNPVLRDVEVVVKDEFQGSLSGSRNYKIKGQSINRVTGKKNT